ncbi:MAG: 1-deoxy-D-xylulose-5-phosphate synthase [Clostridiales bacterium]|nr:1-deoxy-D-xylulose-5-phosphate synthase [Clostridiales bacterium]
MHYSLLDSISSPHDLKGLSIDQLEELSHEIRDFILTTVSKTGGHLASNLGVVELTLALHYVFESPKDIFIWDVGHQSYIHKILTGRKDKFGSLRQLGGLSGFPKYQESQHDKFNTGHSSTSISAALGMARARDLKAEDGSHVIAIIGDGALTGGMAFEALNDAGHSDTNLIVLLNDNEMSISHNVGALAGHLSRVRSSSKYNWFKKGVQNLFSKMPWIGNSLSTCADLVKKGFKSLLVHGMIFEEMGFKYLGPIDGHNLSAMMDVLKQAAKMEGPVLVHAITHKGKGYEYAENNPEFFHGVPPFIMKTGKTQENNFSTFSDAFGDQLVQLAREDNSIVAITAAMLESTGLLKFQELFPQRFFDVGIAEQHAVTMAAGLAAAGLKPYVAIYSTFLQRAFDQILHDVCIQNLPVRLIIDRAGLVGEDGETHHGIFDVSFLNPIPNISILAPKDTEELRAMLDYTKEFNSPIAIRYPRGRTSLRSPLHKDKKEAFDPFTWDILAEGNQLCILAFGKMLEVAFETADILLKRGIKIGIINARSIKPLDKSMLEYLSKRYKYWVSLEDNILAGGFGSSINQYLIKNNLGTYILNLGIHNRFVGHGQVEELIKLVSLDPSNVAQEINCFLNNYKESDYVQCFQTKA